MRELLDLLPQELHDQIYKELGCLKLVKVNEIYLTPGLLHINRATRAKFAKSYYGNTIFAIEPGFGKWFIQNLTMEQLACLTDIRLIVPLERLPPKWYNAADLQRLPRQILGLEEDSEVWQALKKRGVVKLDLDEGEVGPCS